MSSLYASRKSNEAGGLAYGTNVRVGVIRDGVWPPTSPAMSAMPGWRPNFASQRNDEGPRADIPGSRSRRLRAVCQSVPRAKPAVSRARQVA